jgi:two-component system NarL family sensor kinase
MSLTALEVIWGLVLFTAVVCTFGGIFVVAIVSNQRKVVDAQREKLAEAALLEQTLREIPKHVLNAQEKERKRFAVDLHDGVQQVLAGTKMKLDTFRLSRGESDTELNVELRAAAKNLDSALGDIQRVVKKLRPKILDDYGLIPALESLCRDARLPSGQPIEFTHGVVPRMPPDLEEAAYRIIQEAVYNAEKHAHATKVSVHVDLTEGLFNAEIADNGIGIDDCSGVRKNNTLGLGLSSMRERAAVFGGVFSIEGINGQGTTIRVKLPSSPHSA